MKELFLSILEISATTGLIAILLILFTPLLSKRYMAKWKYWLWMILALRLLIPFHDIHISMLFSAPPNGMPSGQILTDTPNKGYSPSEDMLNSQMNEPTFPASNAVQEILPSSQFVIKIPSQMTTPILSQSKVLHTSTTLLDIIAILWLMGATAFMAVHLLSYFYYKKQLLKRGKTIKDDNILSLLWHLKTELRIKRPVVIMEYAQAPSPMILGFLHPILVLPEITYGQEELFFILKHELVHLKRRDAWYKLLLVTANALHWFNPVIWLMQKEAAIDMELSCDEQVVQGNDFAVRKAYTETLLSTLHKDCTKRTLLSTQFYGGKKIMKKRFVNILIGVSKKRGLLSLVGVVLLTINLGAIVSCSMTNACLPIDFGMSVLTDLDGDGHDDYLTVYDIQGPSGAFTYVDTTLHDGTHGLFQVEGHYSSYLITGDLTRNGKADVLLVKYDSESSLGTMEACVLQFEDGEWKEYPSNLIPNPNIDFYQPESFNPEEAPEALYIGATIVQKSDQTLLRLIMPLDLLNSETVECIDASWNVNGWYIEEIQLVENYYTDGHNHRLLENTYEQLRHTNHLPLDTDDEKKEQSLSKETEKDLSLYLVPETQFMDQVASKEEKQSILDALSNLTEKDYKDAIPYEKFLEGVNVTSNAKLALLAQSPTGNATVYGARTLERGLVVKYDGLTSCFDYTWNTLNLYEGDFDQDGTNELCLQLLDKGGTGFYVERLILIEKSADGSTLSNLEFDSTSFIKENLSFGINTDNNTLVAQKADGSEEKELLPLMPEAIRASHTQLIADRLLTTLEDDKQLGLDCCNQVCFVVQDNKIQMNLEIGFQIEKGGPSLFAITNNTPVTIQFEIQYTGDSFICK